MLFGDSVLMRSIRQIHCSYYYYFFFFHEEIVIFLLLLKIGAKPRRGIKIRTHNNKTVRLLERANIIERTTTTKESYETTR